METQLLRALSEKVRRLAHALSIFANDLDACLALGSEPRLAAQAFIKARHVVEQFAQILCEQYGVEWNKHNLYGTLEKLDRTTIPPPILATLHQARIWGNLAAHKQDESGGREALGKVTAEDVAVVVMQLLRALEWYYCERQPPRMQSIYEGQPLLFQDRVLAFVKQFHSQYQPYHSRDAALTDPARVYIPLHCQPGLDGEGPAADALDWIRAGAGSPGGQLLLADYGMGKSFLALQLFLTLALEYEREPEQARVPILYPLKRHRLSRAKPDLILEDLFEFLLMHSFPVFSPQDLTDLLAQGRLLLIFDGIDEIPLVQTLKNPVEVLTRLDLERYGPCPWIATSRKGLFASVLSQADAFGRIRPARLLNWGDVQWTSYVELCDHRLGLFDPTRDEAETGQPSRRLREQFLERISRHPSLQQLTVTPLYARMLVEAREQITEREEISVVELYQTYANLVLAGREDVTMLQDMEFRHECLEGLAVYLFENSTTACTAGELFKFANQYVHSVGQEQLLSFVGSELQTYSLLNCDAMGLLSFSHKSFYEYFLSRALLRQVKAHDWQWPGRLFERRIETGEIEFLVGLLAQPEHETLRRRLEELGPGGSLKPHGVIRRNLVALKLVAKHSLANAQLEDLDLSGLSFRKADLRGACLDSVRAPGGDFSHALMSGCTLVSANLERCNLSGADLTGAVLDFSTLTEVEQSLPPPRLSGASLEGITIRSQDYNYLATAVMLDPDGEASWRDEAIDQLKRGLVD